MTTTAATAAGQQLQQDVLGRRAAASRISPNERRYPFVPSGARFGNSLESDLALRLTFSEMPLSDLSRHDIEDLMNWTFADMHAPIGPRTFYRFRDRYNGRNKEGRSNAQDRQQVLNDLLRSASQLNIVIHPTDQHNIINSIDAGTPIPQAAGNAAQTRVSNASSQATTTLQPPTIAIPQLNNNAAPTFGVAPQVNAVAMPAVVPPAANATAYPAPRIQFMPPPISNATGHPAPRIQFMPPPSPQSMASNSSPAPSDHSTTGTSTPQSTVYPTAWVLQNGRLVGVGPQAPTPGFWTRTFQVTRTSDALIFDRVRLGPEQAAKRDRLLQQGLHHIPIGSTVPVDFQFRTMVPAREQFVQPRPVPAQAGRPESTTNNNSDLSWVLQNGQFVGAGNQAAIPGGYTYTVPVARTANSLQLGNDVISDGPLLDRLLRSGLDNIPIGSTRRILQQSEERPLTVRPGEYLYHNPYATQSASNAAGQEGADGEPDEDTDMQDGGEHELPLPQPDSKPSGDHKSNREDDDDNQPPSHFPQAPMRVFPVWAIALGTRIENGLTDARGQPLLTHEDGPNPWILRRLVRADAEMKSRLENPHTGYDNGEKVAVRPRPDLGLLNQWTAIDPKTARSKFHESTFLLNGEYDKVIAAVNEEFDGKDVLSKPAGATGHAQTEYDERQDKSDSWETMKKKQKKSKKKAVLLSQAQELAGAGLLPSLAAETIYGISWLDRLADETTDETTDEEDVNDSVEPAKEAVSEWEKNKNPEWQILAVNPHIPLGSAEMYDLNPIQAVLAVMYCFAHLSAVQAIHELRVTNGDIGLVLRYNSTISDPRIEWIQGCWAEAMIYVQSERAREVYRAALAREVDEINTRKQKRKQQGDDEEHDPKRQRQV